MDIDEYQREAAKTRITDDDEVFSLGLIGELGSIASALKKARRAKSLPQNVTAYRQELSEEIGDALWYLAAIASSYDISLADVAKENLVKAREFFGAKSDGLFDEEDPEEAQLPRQLKVTFSVRDEDGRVVLTRDGVPAGDPLNSASPVEDNYKYHDVIHLAFAAKLGWSPVLRDILVPKHKRKSPSGENVPDDGARARIIEEAISAILFAQAPKLNWYATPDDVPLRTLELIKRVTADYEVKTKTIPQWQEAICEGFTAFKKIEGKKSAIVSIDLVARTLEVQSTE
jgi:NTP pyrophosphatase (non-canonical NTP hydrolase)